MAVTNFRLRLGGANGLNALMRSGPVQGLVNLSARGIAGRAGANFNFEPRPHKWTARAYVYPSNFEGKLEQARSGVLERALTQGR